MKKTTRILLASVLIGTMPWQSLLVARMPLPPKTLPRPSLTHIPTPMHGVMMIRIIGTPQTVNIQPKSALRGRTP